MRTFVKPLAILLAIVPLLSSCIRDEVEPCPPLSLHIDVKDKNYFNVNKVEQEERKSEDLAFREYVPTLFYTLRNTETGEVVEEQGVFEVTNDEKLQDVEFCDCLPHGKYVITVWGGLKDTNILSDDRQTIALHQNNIEGTDLYLASDTLLYDPWHYDYTVYMERIKGKLIIEAKDLPDNMNHMTQQVGRLYGATDSRLGYSGITHMETTAQWSGDNMTKKTVLSPSVNDKTSSINVDFRNDEGNHRNPNDVDIAISRNMLTVLRYVWNKDQNKFLIYILVNDNWELVHGMEID